MSQQVYRENLYSTKDDRIAKMLIAVGLVIIRSERIPKTRKKYFFFDKDRAKPFVDRWNRGEPIPISDIRQVFYAEDTFNACVHDEI